MGLWPAGCIGVYISVKWRWNRTFLMWQHFSLHLELILLEGNDQTRYCPLSGIQWSFTLPVSPSVVTQTAPKPLYSRSWAHVGKRNHHVWGRALCVLPPLCLAWTSWSCSGVQRAESSILPALHKRIRDGTRGRGEAEKGLDWQTDRQASIDSQTTIINSTLLSSVWCVAQGQVENLSVAASSTNRFPLIFQ